MILSFTDRSQRVILDGFGLPLIGFRLWIRLAFKISEGWTFTPILSQSSENFNGRSSPGSSPRPSTMMFRGDRTVCWLWKGGGPGFRICVTFWFRPGLLILFVFAGTSVIM